MSKAELRLTYEPDDEWLGQLRAVVRSGAFSGHGSAWFDRLGLKETFIAALRAFPLSTSAPPMIEGGFWSKESPGTLGQCHVRITISRYDLRGTLLVLVELATESWATSANDRQQSVTARFFAEYAELERFALQLEQVLDGTLGEAVLAGAAPE